MSERFTLTQERAVTRRSRFRPETDLDRARQMSLFADVGGNPQQPLLFGEALPVAPPEFMGKQEN